MMNIVKQLFWVSRPISWINTAFPFGAGYFMISRQLDWRLLLGFVFFLIPYNVILYGVNDVFDYESDIRNPRKGGVEGAVAAKKLHKPILIACVVVGVPFITALVIAGNLAANMALLVVMAMVLAYSAPLARFKERPLIDSITSSSHFCGPLVYGLVLAGWTAPAWPAVVAFFLWGMASHAFGAVQDIIPDRAGGLASIATRFGAAPTVRFALMLYVLSGILLAAYGWPIGVVGLTVLLYIANIMPFWSLSDTASESANAAWRRFLWLNQVAGFCVTMTLLYIVWR